MANGDQGSRTFLAIVLGGIVLALIIAAFLLYGQKAETELPPPPTAAEPAPAPEPAPPPAAEPAPPPAAEPAPAPEAAPPPAEPAPEAADRKSVV